MEEESQFSIQIKKYLRMLITIWPSLRPGLRNVPQITAPYDQSLLPAKNYRIMNQQTFLETIIGDMHCFIMQHDVKEEDIEDYFYDILDLLNIDEQITASNSQIGGVRYMSREVMKVIHQLQEGKVQAINKFQANIYNPVIQMGLGEVVAQGDNQSENQEENQEGIDQQQEDDEDWEQQQMEAEIPNQQQLDKQKSQRQKQEREQKQKELQDDGWVIVKKK